MIADKIQKNNKKERNMLKTGIIGSLIAAICCFTPLLVLAFVSVGLSGFVGGLDYFLFPMLFASLGLIAQALYLQFDKIGISPKPFIILLVVIFSAILFWFKFYYALRISLLALILVIIYAFWLRYKTNTLRKKTP